jgi:outer membrane protein assembly factor BamE (lipoprotein component of BamABCDE complex)
MTRPLTDRLRALLTAALLSGGLVGVPLTSVVGCAARAEEHFGSMRSGMTKTEVEELLGAPSSKWTSERPGDEGAERWHYGDNLSSLATSGVFREADTDRVYVVWFDANGQVTTFSRPTWSQE